MRNNKLKQTIQTHSVFKNAVITAINSDGTFNAKEKNRDYAYNNLNASYTIANTIKVGDTVSIGSLHGDPQKIEIIGLSSFLSGGVSDISI